MNILIKQVKVYQVQSEHHLQEVDVLVNNGIIQKIDKNIALEEGYKLVEGKSLSLSQGWLDIFADFSEPGYEHRENLNTGAEAALKGGFKQVFVVPNTLPSVSTQSEVLFIKQKTAHLPVKIHPLGSVSNQLEGKDLSEMYEMKTAGAVAFTEGWKAMQDANLMYKALEFIKAWDGVLIYLPYDKSLTDGAWMHEGVKSTLLGMAGMPFIAETIAVQRALDLTAYTGSKIHLTGLSAKESVELVRTAKAKGVKVTCSASVNHLLWTDESLETYNSFYKVMPPLRTEEDRQALIEGVLDGTIDMITSHHRPANWDEKTKEFEYTNWGMANIEFVLPILLKAIPQISAEKLTELLTYNAIATFGQKEVVFLKGAAIKDFTVFDMKEERAIVKGSSKSYNQLSIEEGWKGKIVL